MPSYQYRALTNSRELREGYLDAVDLKTALALLEQQQLEILELRMIPGAPSSDAAADLRLSPDHRIDLDSQALRQRLQEILPQRDLFLPGLQGFIDELATPRQKQALRPVMAICGEGIALQPRDRSGHVDTSWISLLRITSGAGQVVADVIAEASLRASVRQQIFRTLAYPLVVALIALSLFVLMLVYFVPLFADVYQTWGHDTLPATTRLLFALSDGLRSWYGLVWGTILIAICLGIVGMVRQLPPAMREWLLVCLPIGGPLWQLKSQSRFTLHLADLLSVDIPLASALRLAGRASESHLVSHSARQLADAWEASQREDSVTAPFREDVAPWIGRGIQHIVLQDFPRAKSAALLRSLADNYRRQGARGVETVMTALAPCLMALLGGGIGLVTFFLVRPLLRLFSGF